MMSKTHYILACVAFGAIIVSSVLQMRNSHKFYKGLEKELEMLRKRGALKIVKTPEKDGS